MDNCNAVVNDHTKIEKIKFVGIPIRGRPNVPLSNKFVIRIHENLGNLIKQNKLEEIDRWGINSDLWSLCFTGSEKIEEYILLSPEAEKILMDL